MALDRPFDGGLVQIADVAVSASTPVRKYNRRFNVHVPANRPLYLRYLQTQTRQQRRVFLTSEGGRRQSFTQAAPNELKLGEGG